jgi:c-di-GMP-binding flagellar brake protein YcgR
MDKNNNRRSFRRHPANWKVAIVLLAPDGQPIIQHTQTIDLSLGGAAIISEQGGEMGALLTVLLGQPPKRDQDRPKVIKAHARVVSSRKAPSGSGFHLGLSFVSQPGDELGILADLIREMESSPAIRQEEVIEASSSITANSRLARLKELA